MKTSQKINQAIEFAAKVHKKKIRKGKTIPYITHPKAVADLLSLVTDDENILIAGVLHDTIEDCKPYGSVTKTDIEEMFGSQVAQMVDDVTEQDKTLSWMERKLAALKHIKHMSHDSLLLKSADVLHNLSELNDDIRKQGDKVFKKFNASKADTIKRYNLVIPELKKYWADNPLMAKLEKELDTLNKIT